jgi:SAM-dependent methyltransferase
MPLSPVAPPSSLAPPVDAAQAPDTGNNAWYIYHSARHAAELGAESRAAGSAAAERDIDFIVEQLALAPHDRLLEIGCGWGRHSLVLHERGFRRLTSVDIAPAMLAIARDRAEAAGIAADFRLCDFRALGDEPPFDAILSLYDRSCLGYPSEAEDRQSLAFLHGLLRPGGQLWFGIGDWPVALPRPGRDWREWAGGLELLETIPDAAAMTCTDRTTILAPEGRRVYTLTRRHYSLPEIRRLLGDTSFDLIGAWHALDARRPYGSEAEGLFVLVRRGAA